MQSPPALAAEELARYHQVSQRASNGEHQSDEAFQHHAHTHSGRKQRGPAAGVRLVVILIQGPLKSPEAYTDAQRHHHIRDKDTRKQEQADTGSQRYAGIQSGAPAEGPAPVERSRQAQQHRSQSKGNPGSPVMDAERAVRDSDHP